jgi:uncharacterized protein (TIGR02266 family)
MSIPAGRPAQIAKEMLSNTLGSLQDIQAPALDVQALTGTMAKAVGALYAVQFSDPTDPAHVAGVQNAMGFLSKGLEMLQETQSDEAAVQETSRVIARVLAILYPVSKAQENASAPPPPQPRVQEKEIEHHPSRTAPRVACDVDIGFQSDTNFYTGFSEDISEGGLFISTYDFRPIGTNIDVNFTLPSGHTVIARGIVRWVRELNPLHPDQKPGMGIQFVDLPEGDKRAIHEFLEQRTPMFFDE